MVENRKWISVTERLPDYDEFVLWYTDSGYIFVDHLDKDIDVARFLNPEPMTYVTHWMPLPDPPLPDNLKDPVEVLKRGREILKKWGINE